MFNRGLQAGATALMLLGGWAVWRPHPVIGQEAGSAAIGGASIGGAAIGGASIAGGAVGSGGVATVPEAVTTEGADYCAHLQEKYDSIRRAATSPAASEAATLSDEGARLCGHGNTRAGILRLRRALVLIMNPPDPAPPH